MARKVFLLIVSTMIAIICSSSAFAKKRYAALVIDANTGVVLQQENAGSIRHPASLTKMMTLYLTFRALEKRKLKMNQKIQVSSLAASQPASKIGLRKGQYIRVRDAVISVIVKSANDSAVVLAEAVSGSHWQFVKDMNKMSKRLGMNHTNFRNSTGLHDKRQRTTAYDMARLAVALKRDYAQYYHLFQRTRFSYKGRSYRTHNNVLKKYRGATGLKTGYIRASGYNLATSVSRKQGNLVGVVFGGKSSKSRDRKMVSLLDKAFAKIDRRKRKAGGQMHASIAPQPKFRPAKAIARISKFNPVPVLRSGNNLSIASNFQNASFESSSENTPPPKKAPIPQAKAEQ